MVGNTALEVGSGGVPVFATPMLVALMEGAAVRAVQGRLPPGQITVGTRVEIWHTSATPLGMTVTAEAHLEQIDGRKLVFRVSASDSAGPVGHGYHERFIVDQAKFLAKAGEKQVQCGR
ncbi:MAG TPA: thioesterase [Clostridiales bacterium UBA8153]|nr:thioesterase [Clostridiales bacterium UBA8153]